MGHSLSDKSLFVHFPIDADWYNLRWIIPNMLKRFEMLPFWDDILTPTIFKPRGQDIVAIFDLLSKFDLLQ